MATTTLTLIIQLLAGGLGFHGWVTLTAEPELTTDGVILSVEGLGGQTASLLCPPGPLAELAQRLQEADVVYVAGNQPLADQDDPVLRVTDLVLYATATTAVEEPPPPETCDRDGGCDAVAQKKKPGRR